MNLSRFICILTFLLAFTALVQGQQPGQPAEDNVTGLTVTEKSEPKILLTTFLVAEVSWSGRRYALIAGYRYLNVNYNKDDLLFDMALQGPLFGFGIKF